MSDINFVCTNGTSSSFNVQAANANDALSAAENHFDDQSDYILPIEVVSECGLRASVVADGLGDDYNDVEYTDEELGLNDDI